MTQQEYLEKRLYAAEKLIDAIVDLTKPMEVSQAAWYATWKQWEETEPPAPAQGVDWNKPDENGIIHVPDELDPLINKVATQIRFHTISGKSEEETVCDIVRNAEKFFTGSRWQQGQLTERLLRNDPVNFLLSNAMRYLTEPQKIALRDALIERTPLPAPTIGARWVRASERLPKEHHNVFIRYGNQTERTVAFIHNGVWHMHQGSRKSVEDLEWLDESLTLPTREQAQAWAKEASKGSAVQVIRIDAALAMYDWIMSKTTTP